MQKLLKCFAIKDLSSLKKTFVYIGLHFVAVLGRIAASVYNPCLNTFIHRQ